MNRSGHGSGRAPTIAIACPGVGLVQRGFERFSEDLFHVLKDDLDITLFKGGGAASEREVVLKFASRNGALTRFLPVHALFGRTRMHSECMTFALALLPHLARGRFDVVHCIDPPLARVLSMLRTRLGLQFRLLYTEGSTMPPSDYPPSDHIQQIAEETHREALAAGIPASRMTVLPPGIHPSRFGTGCSRQDLRRKHGISDETFVILCVAAINRVHKRVDHLIEEASRLEGDVLLWLDGSMDQGDPTLVDLARSRLGDRCRVTSVASERVGELYRLADIMVLPSVTEAFGLVVVEALAAGAPVLTHDSPHFRWLVPNPACHVDMRAEGALAARLAHLRDHRTALRSMTCAADATRRFDWRNLKLQYLELYRRVADLPAPGRGGRWPEGAGPASSARIDILPWQRLKSATILTLRELRLLKPADTCRFWFKRLRSWPQNRRFRRNHPDFATPPPHLAFDALNHADWSLYRESGLRHGDVFARLVLDALDQESLDILEWGCGPGRLIRHMGDLLPGRRVKLTGADCNGESVAWCRANLAGIEFIENQFMPPLALPDDRFDVVYVFSVFTHLSEVAQRAWAGELLRVLRPGGLLVCTTHGDRYRFHLAGRRDRLLYNAGEVVVKSGYMEGRKWFLAVHPPAFVRESLLKCFSDVRQVKVAEDAQLLQDVWTARKGTHRSPL